MNRDDTMEKNHGERDGVKLWSQPQKYRGTYGWWTGWESLRDSGLWEVTYSNVKVGTSRRSDPTSGIVLFPTVSIPVFVRFIRVRDPGRGGFVTQRIITGPLCVGSIIIRIYWVGGLRLKSMNYFTRQSSIQEESINLFGREHPTEPPR